VYSLTIVECDKIEVISSLIDNYSVSIGACRNVNIETIRFTNVHCLSVGMLKTEAHSQLLSRALSLKYLEL
jgi:hypothetical protein